MIGIVVAGFVCVSGRRVWNLDLVTLGALFMGLSFGILMGYGLADNGQNIAR